MASEQELLQAVATAPQGPETMALFDFDGTVIAGYSVAVFIRDALQRNDMSVSELLVLGTALTRFGLGTLGFSAMMASNASILRGAEEAGYRRRAEELYEAHIARRVYPETRRLIEAHRARGHTLAILSSATAYQVEPAARDLRIDRVYCTALEVKHGRFTGAIEHPTCFGAGKLLVAHELAAQLGTTLDNAFFYSDSCDDLALLQRAGRPCVLNGSHALVRHACARGWPHVRFPDRGRPGIGRFLRSVAARATRPTA